MSQRRIKLTHRYNQPHGAGFGLTNYAADHELPRFPRRKQKARSPLTPDGEAVYGVVTGLYPGGLRISLNGNPGHLEAVEMTGPLAKRARRTKRNPIREGTILRLRIMSRDPLDGYLEFTMKGINAPR